MTAFAEIGAENELALTRAAYGRFLAGRGQPQSARGHLTRALEVFERLGTYHEPQRVREAMAALPG